MNAAKIGPASNNISVAPARVRETPPPVTPFKDILQGGAQLLISGARVAGSVVGGPVLSAAVSRLGAAASGSSARSSLSSLSDGSSDDTGGLDAYRSAQQQRLSADLKLLSLQNEIQQHSRQISLISNVMKVRHETAKSTIGNIRS